LPDPDPHPTDPRTASDGPAAGAVSRAVGRRDGSPNASSEDPGATIEGNDLVRLIAHRGVARLPAFGLLAEIFGDLVRPTFTGAGAGTSWSSLTSV
jgi:hypothetical protein